MEPNSEPLFGFVIFQIGEGFCASKCLCALYNYSLFKSGIWTPATAAAKKMLKTF